MKYLILFLILFSVLTPVSYAQELPENTIESATTNPTAPVLDQNSQSQTATQSGTSPTVQRTTRSNMSCVAVGSSPGEKPAICTQQAQTDPTGGGMIGPIGGGPVELEACGQSADGSNIMCIKPGYVFYCQGDPRWGNTCSMASAACGPTTMAMILSAYGDTILPPDMDKMFQQRGWRACGDSPSYMQTAVQKLLPEMGYEYHALGVPLNLGRAQEFLDAGYLIIGSTFGHIFVIDGVNPQNNTVRLRDPGRCENAGGVIRSASTPWGGQSLYYAYAVKKKPIRQ